MIRWFWRWFARRRKVIIIQYGCEWVMLEGRIVPLPALSRKQGKQQSGESQE
jgi:hypothetical protein